MTTIKQLNEKIGFIETHNPLTPSQKTELKLLKEWRDDLIAKRDKLNILFNKVKKENNKSAIRILTEMVILFREELGFDIKKEGDGK
ncbi:MAG TPA: hypothetical protein VIR31_04475 [Nitrososphaeraceae archaeon]